MSPVRAPQIEAAEDRLLDPERIHEIDHVTGQGGGLAVSNGIAGKKARRAVAAQIRNDHPVAGRRERGGDVDVAVNVVRPAVEENDRPSPVGARLRVRDVEEAGRDLLERAERRVGSRRDRRDARRLGLAGLCGHGADVAQLDGCDAHRHGADEVTATGPHLGCLLCPCPSLHPTSQDFASRPCTMPPRSRTRRRRNAGRRGSGVRSNLFTRSRPAGWTAGRSAIARGMLPRRPPEERQSGREG